MVIIGSGHVENYLRDAPVGSGRHDVFHKQIARDPTAMVESIVEGLEQVR